MAFSIPDKNEAAHELQSVLFQEYIDVLLAGIAGTEHVVSGCAVTASSGMGLAVSAGAVVTGGIKKVVSSATPTISASDVTYPRLDFIYVNSSGAVVVRTGTAATNPKPPTKASTDVVLAVVYVPAGDTAIASNQIVDLRVMKAGGKHTVAIPAGALATRKESGVGCSSLATVIGATGQPDIPYLAFSASVAQYASIVIPMPAGWNEGTVTASFQWRRAANTAAGNVVWGVRAAAVSDNETPVLNFGSDAVVIDAASTTLANFNLSAETAACTIGGTPAEGDLVFFEFFRKADDATNDTLADAAWLTSVKLHYSTEVDSDA